MTWTTSAGSRQQWAHERPDLDTSAMGIIGRLHRLADALDAELRPVFEAAGLSDGDFDVLAALRRAGAPFELTPGRARRDHHDHLGHRHQARRPPRGGGLGDARACRSTTGAYAASRSPLAGRALVDEVVGRPLRQRGTAARRASPTSSAARLTRLLTQWTMTLGRLTAYDPCARPARRTRCRRGRRSGATAGRPTRSGARDRPGPRSPRATASASSPDSRRRSTWIRFFVTGFGSSS